jgi:hypothetical protein
MVFPVLIISILPLIIYIKTLAKSCFKSSAQNGDLMPNLVHLEDEGYCKLSTLETRFEHKNF